MVPLDSRGDHGEPEASGDPEERRRGLRHTFASIAVGRGQSLPIIGKLLGHRQPSTTARYAHLADDPVRRATADVGEALSEMLGAEGKPGTSGG